MSKYKSGLRIDIKPGMVWIDGLGYVNTAVKIEGEIILDKAKNQQKTLIFTVSNIGSKPTTLKQVYLESYEKGKYPCLSKYRFFRKILGGQLHKMI